LRNGYLYLATPNTVVRYKMAAGALTPTVSRNRRRRPARRAPA
jgi:hypothetical protein